MSGPPAAPGLAEGLTVQAEGRASLAPAPLWRRLAAMVYEALIAAALLLAAGLIFQLLTSLLEPPGGASAWRLSGWPRLIFQLYLAGVLGGYFSWSWHRGRTLAMRTWRLRLVRGPLDLPPSWGAALARYVAALVLLGPALAAAIWLREHPASGTAWLMLVPGAGALAFAVTNEARSTLYDRIAATRLVMEDRPRPS